MSIDFEHLRVQGVSIPDVGDYREAIPEGKWSQFFGALSRRTHLAGITRPTLSTSAHYLNLARSFRPQKQAWKARAGSNTRFMTRLNTALVDDLVARRDSYDLIVQLQTLCSPRSPRITAPYAIYTDNTMALTQRLYPAYVPLPPRAARARQAFEADVCRGAALVATFSEFARRSVIEDYGVSPDRVAAVGAGANQLIDSLKDKDYGARRALFVGSPFERKGGKQLLEAWQLVRHCVPDAELTLVGPRRDPAPGFGHGVSWRGWVNRAEIAHLYRSASVFVMPSIFEPWGHVFVEAMGHGLPCIGSDCCAMPELISDGVSGRLVARGDVRALADALVEVLTNPDQAAGMGYAGHARVLKSMSWDDVALKFLSKLRGRL